MGATSTNITDQVMKHIKEKIIIGKWAVESRIPSENELCRELGYSRTSIRSAIQRYNELGVLESRRGSGTYVVSSEPFFSEQNAYSGLFGNPNAKVNTDSFRKWRQVRNIIEPEIAYRVAKNATPELIEKLKRINQEHFEARGNQEQFIAKDIEFHLTLAEFLNNDILNNIMQLLFSMKEKLIFSNEEFGYFGGGYFHLQITDAIENHNADRARILMEEHQAEISESHEMKNGLI